MYYFLAILIIVSTSLYVFFPSFNLAVFGDFWVTAWRYELMVGIFSKGVWNHLTYFQTLYGPQDITTGLLSRIFDFQSAPYYIISYLMRLLASFSFYPITLLLTKNKLASFFAILFFSITPIGLETTNWVFNMTSYLTVTFFNFFLYFFIKLRENTKLKSLILTSSLFYTTIISSPIRTTSLVPLIISIELFWLLNNRDSRILKRVILRLSLLILIFLFLLLGTTTYSSPDWDKQTIKPSTKGIATTVIIGVESSLKLIQNGQSEFLLYALAEIGGMFIPNLSGTFEIPFALIGGILIIVWLVLVIKQRKSYLADIFIISLLWTLFPLLIPWIRDPNFMFPTTHRYLIISAGGFSLFLAALISIVHDKKNKLIMLLLVLTITLIHLFSTSSYLNKLLAVRNQQLSNKIWSQIPKFSKDDFSKGPLAFYFTGENGEIVHNVLTFGFPSRIQLIYGLADYKSVVTLGSFEESISAVTDGKSLIKHGLPEQPISLTNILTFQLEGTDKLIDTTATTRDKLSQLLKR